MRKTLNTKNYNASLDSVVKKHDEWQKNEYKNSNKKLYDILTDCYAIYLKTSGKRELSKALDSACAVRGVKFRSQTALSTKLVRYVFKGCGDRAFAYAAVLEEAQVQKIAPTKLAAWIRKQNGVENIRRSRHSAPQLSPSKLRELALDQLEKAPAIAEIDQQVEALSANSKAKHRYAVALIRQSSKGKTEIVYSSNQTAVVNHVLAAAGRDKQKEGTVAQTEAQASKRVANSLSAIEAALADGEAA